MAWLEQRGTRFRINFRVGERHISKSLKTGDPQEAHGCLVRLEENLRLLERGRLECPPDADLAAFLLSDGKVTQAMAAPPLSLTDLFAAYRTNLPAGAIEENSRETLELHMKHLERHLGARFPANTLNLLALQSYIDRRSKERGHRGRRVSPATLKKEMTSFSGIWTWAVHAGMLQGSFPNRGLKYPKECEKPPFQTWKEIEAQIARGGVSEVEQQDLWDCLFLTLPEIGELLTYIKTHARHGFLYPMAVCAAHTGARRSELIRSRINDIDLAGGTILLQEKKRVKGKRTYRRVPLSPVLAPVIKEWLARHPGGVYTFCQELHVSHSGKVRSEYGLLTRNETHHHLQNVLAGSTWKRIRGWHVFRHSFASNCAARGVDQRLIDAWMGHQTEEMRKRYRHLLPDSQQAAMRLVFATP